MSVLSASPPQPVFRLVSRRSRCSVPFCRRRTCSVIGSPISASASPLSAMAERGHVGLDRLQSVVIAILMPFFFMTTGLRTLIDLNSLGFLDILSVATVIAIAGKILGAMLAARLTGESWADSFTLGALVQPRG